MPGCLRASSDASGEEDVSGFGLAVAREGAVVGHAGRGRGKGDAALGCGSVTGRTQ